MEPIDISFGEREEEHELRKPSCPLCGEPFLFAGGKWRCQRCHFWLCESCEGAGDTFRYYGENGQDWWPLLPTPAAIR